jgi:hypothetical protein
MRLTTPVPWALLFFLFLPGCDKSPTLTETAADPSQDAATTQESVTALHGEPFDIAEVFFEFNTTDNDLGFQLLLDAEGWHRVTLANPRNQQQVRIVAEGQLADLGITELRFESAEPSPQEVLRKFPAGEYTLRGTTVEGVSLLSRARLSHHFAPRPTFTPRNGQLVDPRNTVVRWNAPQAERVEVIIENADLGHVFDVIVSGSTDRLTVPRQFLRPGKEYNIEILSIHTNGNRTIAESTFRTRQ